MAEQALREAALVRLSEGDPRGANALAARLVELNPFDENFQELLVCSYAEVGDPEAAHRQARAAADLARHELGREPTPAIAKAAVAVVTGAGYQRGRAGLSAQFEMGLSAVRAGAVDTGIETLRRAAASAGTAHSRHSPKVTPGDRAERFHGDRRLARHGASLTSLRRVSSHRKR